jgi:predicted  nucleic acid-binding Zn-ribbon protein
MVSALRDVLLTLHDDFLDDVQKVLDEVNLPDTATKIPVDAAIQQFRNDRDIMLGLISQDRFPGLPFHAIEELKGQIEGARNEFTQIIPKNDVSNRATRLVNHLIQLHYHVFLYNLDGRSQRFVTYQQKLEDISKIEEQLRRLSSEWEDKIGKLASVENIQANANDVSKNLSEIHTRANQAVKELQSTLVQGKETQNQIAAILASVGREEQTTKQQSESAKNDAARIDALKNDIQEFHEEIDGYRKNISDTTRQAREAVEKNNAEKEELIVNLQKLENDIKDRLQKATGISLFHTFDDRMRSLRFGKRFWAFSVFLFLACTLGVTVYILSTTTTLDIFLYVKISMAIPLAYGIVFCTQQYSRERRLEEEYAFKSNVSISLTPYRELVETLVAEGKPEEQSKYANFVIDTISEVFRPPDREIFETKQKGIRIGSSTMKQLTALIEAIANTLKK